jgi:hypothetical protein
MNANPFQAFIDQMMGKKPPTAEEIDEMCRDPDSSGCDLDMLDQLKVNEAAAARAAARVPAKKPRWSAEIDDAVFKTD